MSNINLRRIIKNLSKRVLVIVIVVAAVTCIMSVLGITMLSGLSEASSAIIDLHEETSGVTVDGTLTDLTITVTDPEISHSAPPQGDSGYDWGMLENDPNFSTEPPVLEEPTTSVPNNKPTDGGSFAGKLPNPDDRSTWYIPNLTDAQIYEFATLIYLESGITTEECQYACGSVVINRYTLFDYPSLSAVIYEKNQFTPAPKIPYTTPNQQQIDIAIDLCMNGPTIPEYVTYFRINHYHQWSTVADWKKIDCVYFSYSYAAYDKWLAEQEQQ